MCKTSNIGNDEKSTSDEITLNTCSENKSNCGPKSGSGTKSLTEKWNGGIDSLSSPQQLMILSVIMFISFGAHNLLQEAMMKLPGFKYGIMLGYMEVLGVSMWSFLERKYIAKETGRIAPLSSYPLLTLCLMGSSSLSTMSLNYINFPTKVVFRSCKLIPTMFIATIINKRKFSSLEYVCATAVCAGLVMFAAADWRLTPTFSPLGLVLVSLSVVADSITPNMQENLFNQGCSRLEVTLFSNFFTLVAMTFTTFVSGDLMGIVKHAMDDRQLALYMVVYTSIAYVAISAFMSIVKRFGAVTSVLLSTARKGMTLILSFLLFPKEFSWCYAMGALLVLGGLLAASLIKQKRKLESLSTPSIDKISKAEMNVPGSKEGDCDDNVDDEIEENDEIEEDDNYCDYGDIEMQILTAKKGTPDDEIRKGYFEEPGRQISGRIS